MRILSCVICLGLSTAAFLLLLGFQPPLPPVYFNHATLFVSPATYAALSQSTFLQNEFSGFNEHTTQRDGGKWSYTGIYLYGQHTYLEFMKAGPTLGPGGPRDVPAGVASFGMWIDDRNQLPVIRDRLAAQTHAAAAIDTNKAFRNGKEITWFDSASLRLPFDQSILTGTWVMSVYPDFLKQTRPDLKPEEDGPTREKTIGRRYLPGRLLQDVTGLTLTVSKAERNGLLQQFRAYGYAIRSERKRQIAIGPQSQFVLLLAQPNAPRTLAIDLSLTHEKDGERTYRFGDASELRFQGDRTATWTFTLAHN
jgi:hypothetical protein